LLAESSASFDSGDALLRSLGLRICSENADAEAHALSKPEYVTDPGDLEAKLNEDGEARAILLYRRPEMVVAEQMAQGVEPTPTAATWLESIGRWMTVFRRHRRRIMLIDIESVIAESAEFAWVLKESTGVVVDKIGATQLPDRQAPDPVMLAIASLFLQQDRDSNMSSALAEIEASSTNLGDSYVALPAAADVNEFYGRLVRSCERTQDLERENELLLLQLHQIQEELETYYDETISAGKRVTSVEAELKDCRSQRKKLQSKRDQLSVKLSEARRDLRSLRSSASWRITRPMRWLSKSLGYYRRRSGHVRS
jgi:hypothetical protein